MRRLLGFVLLACIANAGLAQPPPAGTLYLTHCARCHGRGGGGDGPDAALFIVPPADLRAAVQAQPTEQLVRLVLDGRTQQLGLAPPRLRDALSDREAIIAYLQRLPSIDWSAADPGRELYLTRCMPCHGEFGRPGRELPAGVRPPQDLSDPAFQRAATTTDLVVAVRHGRAGMPALTPRVTPEQATQLAAFVRLLSPGYATYTSYCADCHGDHGIGGGSLGEGYAAPTVVFNRAYFERQDAAQLRRDVDHMLDQHQPTMPHFRAVLDEKEAAAIVQFLKQL